MNLLPVSAESSQPHQTCSLTRRVTTKELIALYCDKIEIAQEEYKEKIAEADDYLKSNVRSTEYMDECFGTPEEDLKLQEEEDEAPAVQKDGTKKLTCPIIPCDVRTFKLRRHLQSVHSKLSEIAVDKALIMSRIMENNKKSIDTNIQTKAAGKTSRKKLSNNRTNLVNRKQNYKKCSLCESLCLNMTNHIGKTHGIPKTDARYYSLVVDCEVVPRCYVSIGTKGPQMLIGQELENAKSKFSSCIEEQSDTLNKLKTLREQMEELKKKIDLASGEKESTEIQEKLNDLYEQYKEQRYKDTKPYTERMKIWKNSFFKYLTMSKYVNAKRASTMAFDILLLYKERTERDITFDDLIDGKILREMLTVFREQSSLASSSKIKYIHMLGALIKFLLIDIDSPERKENETDQSLLSKDIKMKAVKHELDFANSILSKDKGAEVIATKRKAKSKLISCDETAKLLSDLNVYFEQILLESPETLALYTEEQARSVRDSLIAAGTLRLGRRSKELMKMTVTEVRQAVNKKINNEQIFIIEVMDQKSTKSGQAAPVAFSDREFQVLNLFLKTLRPKIIGEAKCSLVFPSSKTTRYNALHELSYAGAWKVLQKFRTASGKRLSSRVARASLITNSRKSKISEEEARTLAKAMNHSYDISNKHYDFTEVADAAADAMAIDLSRPSEAELNAADSTSVSEKDLGSSFEIGCDKDKLFSKEQCESSNQSANEFSLSRAASTSTPNKKRKFTSADIGHQETCLDISSADDTLDKTLKTLRSKKIKICSSIYLEKQEQLEYVKKLVSNVVKEKTSKHGESCFKTDKGNLSINLLKNSIPKSVKKMFSAMELRRIIEQCLEAKE